MQFGVCLFWHGMWHARTSSFHNKDGWWLRHEGWVAKLQTLACHGKLFEFEFENQRWATLANWSGQNIL
jgi:hypothetical protein